jgi:hypothetical protein
VSVITDFFVATPEALARLKPLNFSEIYEQFPVVQTNRIDPVKIATLEAILSNKDFDELAISDPIIDWGEQWVFAIKDSLVQSLAVLSAVELEEAATTWAATEEWQLDRVKVANLSVVLQQISILAKLTKAGSRMFVYMSL